MRGESQPQSPETVPPQERNPLRPEDITKNYDGTESESKASEITGKEKTQAVELPPTDAPVASGSERSSAGIAFEETAAIDTSTQGTKQYEKSDRARLGIEADASEDEQSAEERTGRGEELKSPKVKSGEIALPQATRDRAGEVSDKEKLKAVEQEIQAITGDIERRKNAILEQYGIRANNAAEVLEDAEAADNAELAAELRAILDLERRSNQLADEELGLQPELGVNTKEDSDDAKFVELYRKFFGEIDPNKRPDKKLAVLGDRIEGHKQIILEKFGFVPFNTADSLREAEAAGNEELASELRAIADLEKLAGTRESREKTLPSPQRFFDLVRVDLNESYKNIGDRLGEITRKLQDAREDLARETIDAAYEPEAPGNEQKLESAERDIARLEEQKTVREEAITAIKEQSGQIDGLERLMASGDRKAARKDLEASLKRLIDVFEDFEKQNPAKGGKGEYYRSIKEYGEDVLQRLADDSYANDVLKFAELEKKTGERDIILDEDK